MIVSSESADDLTRTGIFPLFAIEFGIQKQIGEPKHAVHGSADFVTHVGQELALGTVGVFGGDPELGRFLKLLPDGMGLLLDSLAQHEHPGQDHQGEQSPHAQHGDGVRRGPPGRTLDHHHILRRAQQDAK